MKPPIRCVLDTSVASDVQAAGLWAAIARLPGPFLIPEVVAATEFRDADLAGARSVGVVVESLTGDEQADAAALTRRYRRPSRNDLAALALARSRSALLLTGDGPLRETAVCEKVEVHGVLWLLDALVREAAITPAGAAAALGAMLADGSRLPHEECQRRLRAWRA